MVDFILGASRLDRPFWLNAIWNQQKTSFIYLERYKTEGEGNPSQTESKKNPTVPKDGTVREEKKVFDENFMKDETETDNKNVHVTVHGNKKQGKLFVLRSLAMESKATTLCRTNAISKPTYGIQTLNLMLDPAKSSQRVKKFKADKAKYHKDFGQLDFAKSYNNLFELLWYTKLPCFDVKDVTSKQNDEMSVIKRCYWRGRLINCALIFVTRPTDRGMCCTFNTEQAERVLRDTKYGNVTSALQKADRRRIFGDTSLPKW